MNAKDKNFLKFYKKFIERDFSINFLVNMMNIKINEFNVDTYYFR